MHDFPFTMEYVLRDVCNAELKRDRANGKGEVVVCCPLRSGKTFEVNLYKEYWKCFKGCTDCPVNGKGGLLDLYRLYFHCEDKKEAYRRIMDTMSSNEELVERRKKEKKSPTKVAQIADADALDKTYSALLSELVLSKEHRRDLLKRGLSSKDIDVMGFRSIPQTGLNIIAAHLYHSGCQIEGIPGFYFENQEPRMACFGSGYFIPYRNQGGKIVGLQIRYDVEIKPEMSAEEIHDAKKRRYRWLTSSFKQGGTAAANMACDTPDYDDGIPIALYGPFTDAKLFGYLGCSVSFFTQNGELFPGIQFCSFAFCAQRIPSTVGFTKVFFVFLRKEPGSSF